MERRTRVLFIGEGVTLAHISRLSSLNSALSSLHYEKHFACDLHFADLVDLADTRYWRIRSVEPQDFLDSIARGQWPWDYDILSRQVKADCRLLSHIQPDFVVGDMRQSLSISAPFVGIPHLTLTNAYWSPYHQSSWWPVPAYPGVGKLSVSLARLVFNLGKPFILRKHLRTINRLRDKYKLTPFTSFLSAFTHGDHTLYADLPAMYRMRKLPDKHTFIGPVDWEPAVGTPSWWEDALSRESLIYVCLGSSGDPELLKTVVQSLRSFEGSVAVSSSGHSVDNLVDRRIYVEKLLPGSLMARHADLVICNGGSPAAYQALQYGTPLLGIPSNLDQFMMMKQISRLGLGAALRADRLTTPRIERLVKQLLNDQRIRTAAQRIAATSEEWDYRGRFNTIAHRYSRVAPQRPRSFSKMSSR